HPGGPVAGRRRGTGIAAGRVPGRAAGDRVQPRLPARRRRERGIRHGAAEADQPASPGADPGRRRRLLVSDHADQAALLTGGVRMRAVAVRGTSFRLYERLEVTLEPGLVGVVGPNGAGKTALVEMVHFGALGYSPRTSTDAQLVRFGAEVLRTELDAETAAGTSRVEIGFRPGEP